MVRSALARDSDGSQSGPGAPRVLFATGTYPDPSVFRTDFAWLDPEVIEWMAGCGVVLVGVDTPSVDAADSKELPTHQAVRRHDMNILEGVVLDGVPQGWYELIALPLRLEHFDGSPVRAVLRAARG
jgi:arylformamidase